MTVEPKEMALEILHGLGKEELTGHSTMSLTKLQEILGKAGANCKMVVDEDGDKTLLLESPIDGSEVRFAGAGWEQQMQALKYGSPYGFYIIKPDAEREVEFRYRKTDETVRTYDIDGNPIDDTGEGLYAVVNNPDLVPGGYGWCWDTPENRDTWSISALNVSYILARMFTGDTNSSMGRGFAYSGNLQMISKWAREEAIA